jgi:uncharacterized membrane protein YcjF (UPF0283 family)
MLQQVRIRSRMGNVFLATLGALFSVASIALLVFYVVSTWGANSLIDHALQLMLLIGAATGVLFVSIGRENLQHPR